MQQGCRQDLLETKGETLALLMTLLSGMAVVFFFSAVEAGDNLVNCIHCKDQDLCKLFTRPEVEQTTPR